jgi:hypothetical protein
VLDRARALIPILANRAPAASSRARRRRSFPKSHPPSIPETSLGQTRLRKVGNFADRSKTSDLRSRRHRHHSPINSLCRHALSKARPVSICGRTGPLCPSTNAGSRGENT